MGLSSAGKTTVFNALAGARATVGGYSAPTSDPNLAAVKVPDPRLDAVALLFKPKKVTPAEVQYVDVAGIARGSGRDNSAAILAHLRNTDLLLQVVRAFGSAATRGTDPTPLGDLEAINLELAVADLDVVEKRLERLRKEVQHSKGGPAERQLRESELELFGRLHEVLAGGRSLMGVELAPAEEKLLRGYGFLTAKPRLVLLNGDEPGAEADRLVAEIRAALGAPHQPTPGPPGVASLAGKLEAELAELGPEEASEFREALGMAESDLPRVIQFSYRLASLISFFTVGVEECRAWTIRTGSSALDAAGMVHTDMARGFIRAEVIRWDQLVEAGSFAEARRRGHLRAEGKTYPVQDGDVITILFNV